MRILICVFLAAAAAVAAQPLGVAKSSFEGQPVVLFENDRLHLQVMERGGALVNLYLKDDPEKLSPFWNPVRMARELGQTRAAAGSLGHFVCVDGFGQPSAEERAAGFPGHGEAHNLPWEIVKAARNGATSEITFRTRLPLVQETFTRTFRIADGENVIYVDSTLESEVAFDRPASWAEHTTLGSPFLEAGKALSSMSGSRAQNRTYEGRGNPGAERRLAPGKDFTWPMAPALDGSMIDLTAPPVGAHYLDHATVLMDPAERLAWVATVQTSKNLVIGYLFRREEYPWLQNWGSYPDTGKFARGLEFSTQPYDESRRLTIAKNGMFGAPSFRWLPAKGSISSSFFLFYAHTPVGFGKVTSVRQQNGELVIEDGSHRISLKISRPL